MAAAARGGLVRGMAPLHDEGPEARGARDANGHAVFDGRPHLEPARARGGAARVIDGVAHDGEDSDDEGHAEDGREGELLPGGDRAFESEGQGDGCN